MRWIEARFQTKSEEIDALSLELNTLGVDGLLIEDENDFNDFLENNQSYWDYVDDNLREQFRGKSEIRFYLQDNDEGRKKLDSIRESLHRGFQLSFIKNDDWVESGKENYNPIPIGDKLLVLPKWDEIPDTDRISLRLNPGLGFGTGLHPSTRMCLLSLESISLDNKTLLDIGCGSGILGIGALLLGCSHVKACDIDTLSSEWARANAELNDFHSDRYMTYAGDILTDTQLQQSLAGSYDIVVANIVADVIISLSKLVGQYMTSNSLFICSGIRDDRASDVEEKLIEAGFIITGHRQEEEWHCLECRLS